jgi:predicted TIM-barrel fold metal-dependent hydrolase
MGIIDFRLRPPVAGYLDMIMYANAPRRDRATRMHGFEPAKSAVHKSVDMLLQEMDRAGVTTGVMVGRVSKVFGSVSNEDLLRIQADYPGRFIGIPSIDPVDRRAAEAEIDHAAQNGFRAVGIEPGLSAVPMHIDDRRLYPLYAKLEDMKVPVVVMAGGNAGPDLSYTDPVHIDRVAGDFPELKIVATHGAWPWVHQILHVAYRRPNLFLSPDQYLANMPGMDDFVRAADGYLADRFVYASSYPFTPVDKFAEWFRRLPIREENRHKVMYQNAATLLGI